MYRNEVINIRIVLNRVVWLLIHCFQDDLDLRNKIYSLKKQLSQTNGENHLLKVKIRKLQDEVNKKDKQMDLLIDPGNVHDKLLLDAR